MQTQFLGPEHDLLKQRWQRSRGDLKVEFAVYELVFKQLAV